MPEHNRCWYVGKYVEIKRKYDLVMDQAEVDAIMADWEACEGDFEVIIPSCAK
ncbi:MAG: hypothetical protein OXO51_15060 [Gemmatimonadota bacterium]|nr:hypothetical protein [Gemmatimonadota bacterium]